jgi:hypothetical protein
MNMSRRLRWAGNVTRLGEKRNAYRLLVKKPKEREHWEDRDVGGWIYDGSWRDGMGRCGLDCSGLGEGPVEGSCEHGDTHSGSIKCWEVLEWLPSEMGAQLAA